MPWVIKLASSTAVQLASDDHHFANAINTHCGMLTNQPVAEAHDLPFEAIAT
jgi:alanine dehydrogenase